jgi:hypothetical protein
VFFSEEKNQKTLSNEAADRQAAYRKLPKSFASFLQKRRLACFAIEKVDRYQSNSVASRRFI